MGLFGGLGYLVEERHVFSFHRARRAHDTTTTCQRLAANSSEMSPLCSLFLCFIPCVMCSLARLSPWYSYYIAVGNLLTNTFTHHATLLETLIFHDQTCRSTYGSLWLDCRNYNAGQALGKTKTTTCFPCTNTVRLQQLCTYEKTEPRTTSSPW